MAETEYPCAADSRPAASRPAPLLRRTLLIAAALIVFHLTLTFAGAEDGLWLPAVGLGFVSVAWFGWWIAAPLAFDLFLARFIFVNDRSLNPGSAGLLVDSLLLTAEICASWWIYSRYSNGSRRLEDPRSATVFLILVPGVAAAAFAALQAGLWQAGIWQTTTQPGGSYWSLAGALWISRALGILVFVPVLFVVATPFLVRWQLTPPDRVIPLPGGRDPEDWTLGEIIETGGLCVGTALLSLVLVSLHLGHAIPGIALWGFSLLLVVWASLRQGLRGGAVAAFSGSLPALVLAGYLGISAGAFSPLQGNILAQCSTALLVGASAGWIRASEARYRQVVGHIPVVLYSCRLPRGFSISLRTASSADANRGEGRHEPPPGSSISEQAEVTLVSSASRSVLGRDAEESLGPFRRWLERIVPEDREIVIAALGQLCLQQQAVVCEYRVAGGDSPRLDAAAGAQSARWVRETLAPHHSPQATLEGWEGVIEDITEQRALSHHLRRTTSMLQGLVANLPTGVFFVQGPIGQPILVNQRARQLLGQREDLSAGLEHLASVYRLHKPDGTLYPANELPVARALRQGLTCTASDIVVHLPSGRQVPLITWAAPVDLTGQGRHDCAVWVLEDITALQQAELARRETEARMRAVIETMAEGVIVQNQTGVIIECNPAACEILGVLQQKLLGRNCLGPETGCIRENGAPFPREDQPDRRAVLQGMPVRDVIMGLPLEAEGKSQFRWILVSAMPLPVGLALSPNTRGARVVTTFADITSHRASLGAQRSLQEELRRAQRLELIGRLASGTVHDFNNLLTIMMGLASLAKLNLPDDHPVHGDLSRIVEAGEQAAHLAGQLLAFGRKRQVQPHDVDLATVIEHSLRLLRGVLPSTIDIKSVLPSERVFVEADETQLKQVVMNLCLNARDAMAQGGTIQLRVERSQPPSEPSYHPGRAAWFNLSVADTGHGIPEADLERIFEPFFSTKESGAGLGLAVVRQIVESFGGAIVATSRLNQGTRMDVWLREALPAVTPRAESASSERRLDGFKSCPDSLSAQA